MADPLTFVGGAASIIQIIASVTKLAKSLSDVREKYKNVSLNITMVASYLTNIRAALEALHAWRSSDTEETEASAQLDKDLGLSLSCCAILITVIDGKLEESGYRQEFGMKQKINYLWLEDILKEYVSNLEGQVRALQLLLTIFQCRTVTEKKQELAKRESRMVIAQVKAETMTLGFGEEEMDDAISIFSNDLSLNSDVNSILFKSLAYKRVYGEREWPKRTPKTMDKDVDPSQNTTQNNLTTDKEIAVDTSPPASGDTIAHKLSIVVPSMNMPKRPPPPPPPPRRRQVAQSAQDSGQNEAFNKSDLPSVSHPQETFAPAPPTHLKPEMPVSPPEIAPQPPPTSGRPVSENPSPQRLKQSHVQGLSTVQDAEYVGPFSGSRRQEVDPATMTAAGSAPVFELCGDTQPIARTSKMEETASPPAPPLPTANAALISGQSSYEHGPTKQADIVSPLHIVSPSQQLARNCIPAIESSEPAQPLPEPSSSLEGFKNQLEHLFEDKDPSQSSIESFGLTFNAEKRGSARSIAKDGLVPEVNQVVEHETRQEQGYPTSGMVKGVTNDDSKSMAVPDEPRSGRMSITSSVDLYDASVKDLPVVEEPLTATSPSLLVDKTIDDEGPTAVDDEREAEVEGLSILNERLASDVAMSPALDHLKIASLNTSKDTPSYPMSEKEVAIDAMEIPIRTGRSPSIIMTPAEDYADQPIRDSHQADTRDITTPTSPVREPPLPPSPPKRSVPLPPIPQSYPLLMKQATRHSVAETATISSGRDSSIVETSSTMSSSDLSMDNSASTMQQSTSNTTATSIGIDPESVAREQAQAHLRNLQAELAAAKRRGDSSAAQASLQKSIEVIRHTYLAPMAPEESKKRSPRLGSRKSVIRFPSLSHSSQTKALGDAAASGQVDMITSLVRSKAVGVDSRSDDHKTPMMRAAIKGHIKVMDVLKNHGADELAVDARGRTVLHIAIESNQPSVVKWLLDAYPPQRPDMLRHKSSILSKATGSIMHRSPRNLREASDSEGSKSLHVAVMLDHGDMVETLLAAAVDMESRNNWDRTPLHQAILYKRRDSFDILIRHGAKIEAVDAQSVSSLHLAAKTGQADMIATLLEKGAKRDHNDSKGNLPIHQAALAGHLLCIDILKLDRKDLSLKTKAGETLLHQACLTKNVELATYLLRENVEVNPWAPPQPTLLDTLNKFKVPLSSLTPLQYASCNGDYEMTLLLLDHEAWVNAATPDGVTPLMMAAESENTNTVNLLLNRGAKVNANMPGTLLTALHISARRGDLETVQQLCRSGANDSARANNGSYARTPAEECEAKCTDKAKRVAVCEYFRTIRNNRWRNSRIKTVANQQPQPYEMVGRANTTGPSLTPMQPISYAPWGQTQVVPQQLQTVEMMYQQQQQQVALLQQQAQLLQQQQQWYDTGVPTVAAVVESPPPYEPGGANISARLASQAPVYRPGDGQGGPRYG